MQQASHLAVVRPTTPKAPAETLRQQAERLWPNNRKYQAQWIRMVKLLRAGGLLVIEGAPAKWHATATQPVQRESRRPYSVGIDTTA